MRIEHVALWCADLEGLRDCYATWLDAMAGEIHVNEAEGFRSSFLTFADGARLELMTSTPMTARTAESRVRAGYTHLALAAGSADTVDGLTARLRAAGIPVVDGLRHTGDGYYESVVLDPEGNRIERTI